MRNTYRKGNGLRYPLSTMAKLLIFVSATIVAIFVNVSREVHAAPLGDVPPSSTSGADEDAGPARPINDNMTVAPAPHVIDVPAADPPRYYIAHQALSFRAGLATDLPKISLDDSVIGFAYLFPKFLSPKLQAGADLHEDARGHIYVGTRWIYFERSYFRPSAVLALDHFFDAKYGLGTLARKEDWFVRGGGSLEHVIWNPWSIKLDGEMIVNFDKTKLLLAIGLSRGF